MNNDYGFAEKHEAVLCLLDEIDRLCRENGIKYSLHGGTLLGAERNGHLIPWMMMLTSLCCVRSLRS